MPCPPSLHTADNELLWLRANTEEIPPVGTPCKIVIRSAVQDVKIVTLTSDGRVLFGDRTVSLRELSAAVQRENTPQPIRRVVLRLAPDVPQARIEAIVAALVRTGIERELINMGTVKFVASRAERNEIRDERNDQQRHASEETAKRLAAETGADYMMKGSLKTQIDAVKGKQVKFYKINFELLNATTAEKVCIGDHEIEKLITQKHATW